MFDWIGSLRVVEKARSRVVLGLGPSTQLVGAAMFVLGGLLALRAIPISWWLASIPASVSIFGAVVFSLKRRLEFDKDDGVLRVSQSAFGIGSTTVVPLFHLRAIVIVARPTRFGSRNIDGTGFVAYIDRRVGEAIYIDEARRSKSLFRMAEAVADLAELRLEYEVSPVIDESA